MLVLKILLLIRKTKCFLKQKLKNIENAEIIGNVIDVKKLSVPIMSENFNIFEQFLEEIFPKYLTPNTNKKKTMYKCLKTKIVFIIHRKFSTKCRKNKQQ